jgi:VCBS repeat-containing protein
MTTNDGVGGTDSDTLAMTVSAVNDIPTFTSFTAAVDITNEDTTVEITLADLLAQGNEADVDGSVTAFLVNSVTSGILRIGTSSANATAWNASTNAIVDATNNAYWTPAADANGILNAFTAVAKDNEGAESATAITVTVNVTAVNDAPTLATPAVITITDTSATDSFTVINGSLVAADVDANTTLTYSIAGITAVDGIATKVGTYGTLVLTTTTGAYTYTPNNAAINALTANNSETFTVCQRWQFMSDWQ